MVLLHSDNMNENFVAPSFSLVSALDGITYNYNDVSGSKATIVMFICNHCPYVCKIVKDLVIDLQKFETDSLGIVAIMSNDVKQYPDDSFEKMKIFGQKYNFFFPYLFDAIQDVARSYGAVCTPDFFLFGRENKLKYRGRYENNELCDAVKEVLQNDCVIKKQNNSVGCSIKWF